MKSLNFSDGVEIIHYQQVFDASSHSIRITFRLANSVDIDSLLDNLYKCTEAKRIVSIFDISCNLKILDVRLYD